MVPEIKKTWMGCGWKPWNIKGSLQNPINVKESSVDGRLSRRPWEYKGYEQNPPTWVLVRNLRKRDRIWIEPPAWVLGHHTYRRVFCRTSRPGLWVDGCCFLVCCFDSSSLIQQVLYFLSARVIDEVTTSDLYWTTIRCQFFLLYSVDLDTRNFQVNYTCVLKRVCVPVLF